MLERTNCGACGFSACGTFRSSRIRLPQ
ncbi:MAG: hypothetical protein KGJ34_01515 [Patescibacteria group bacterium]|nr:hypothetical protein [Patescibacteria group bacterium]